jgi:hypothetical protein
MRSKPKPDATSRFARPFGLASNPNRTRPICTPTPRRFLPKRHKCASRLLQITQSASRCVVGTKPRADESIVDDLGTRTMILQNGRRSTMKPCRTLDSSLACALLPSGSLSSNELASGISCGESEAATGAEILGGDLICAGPHCCVCPHCRVCPRCGERASGKNRSRGRCLATAVA